MTVEVYISRREAFVGKRLQQRFGSGIRDGLYQAGDLLMIPILPGTSVLCMKIAGSERGDTFGGCLGPVGGVQHTCSGVRWEEGNISGAATFIKQDGAITATVTAAMRGSIWQSERSLDYNDAYAHTGITWLYSEHRKQFAIRPAIPQILNLTSILNDGNALMHQIGMRWVPAMRTSWSISW